MKLSQIQNLDESDKQLHDSYSGNYREYDSDSLFAMMQEAHNPELVEMFRSEAFYALRSEDHYDEMYD